MADPKLGRYEGHDGIRRGVIGVTIVGGGGSIDPIPAPEVPTDPVSDVPGGSYVWAATGSDWTTQTLSLQFLLPKADPEDADEWATAKAPSGTDATLTAKGAMGVVIGEGASIKVVASAAIADLAWTLS